jgi:hypothetical protein
LLFTTPDGANFISGVIMHDETIRQNASNGIPLSDLATSRSKVATLFSTSCWRRPSSNGTAWPLKALTGATIHIR